MTIFGSPLVPLVKYISMVSSLLFTCSGRTNFGALFHSLRQSLEFIVRCLLQSIRTFSEGTVCFRFLNLFHETYLSSTHIIALDTGTGYDKQYPCRWASMCVAGMATVSVSEEPSLPAKTHIWCLRMSMTISPSYSGRLEVGCRLLTVLFRSFESSVCIHLQC